MLNEQNISTIYALATPHGSGAIAVIRVSGPKAIEMVSHLFKPVSGINLNQAGGYSLLYGTIFDSNGAPLDDVLVSLFRSPASYTGEDSVEISCHCSPYIIQKTMMLLHTFGAKMAQPGEFTRRAFLNGKMDLAQAESVADLIASETEASHRVAMNQMRGGFSKELAQMRRDLLDITSLLELELDFSEEDVEFADRNKLMNLLDKAIAKVRQLASSFTLGNAIKNGVPVAIVGATNTGKSTLLNALVGEEKAIVSSIHGTTRDSIEDTVNMDGIMFRFIDTAGIRSTRETIEMIGIERTYSKIKQAAVVIMVLDAEKPEFFDDSIMNVISRMDIKSQKLVIFINKVDKVLPEEADELVEMAAGMAEMAIDGAIAHNAAEEGTYTPDWNESEEENSPALSGPDSLLAVIQASARHGIGLTELRDRLVESQSSLRGGTLASAGGGQNATLVTNQRHYEALQDACEALLRVRGGVTTGIATDLVAQDLREALYHLGTITGQISTEEVLGNIFERFCIGK